MKTINLSRGQVAIVDECMYEELNRHKWYARYDASMQVYYAARHSPTVGNGKKKVYMHRQILNAQAGEEVDHKDHNTLNNRLSNIRICTSSQNNQNQRLRKDNTSGFKGVSFHRRDKKWQAIIFLNGKRISLGRFHSKIQAACAYDKKARELFGKFAYTNFRVPIGKTMPVFVSGP